MTIVRQMERLHIVLEGAVQGVGFRPTVYRLAARMRLSGWVRNTNAGLEIEVEGDTNQVEAFVFQLKAERPGAAVVTTEAVIRVAPSGSVGFEILSSDVTTHSSGSRSAAILPDLATCKECVAEIFDPANRRFGYPFTNCTLCGPRYTILLDIPYDRPNTTMREFALCSACRREYDSYQDRRFHAQPNACPACGPHLWVWPAATGETSPLAEAAHALAEGKIVALKGTGGFHLLVDACSRPAVQRLRERKHRDHKPFALLMPSIACVQRYCDVSLAEGELLLSSAAPIVLLQPKAEHNLAPEVSQASPMLGIMLPSSPILHLLMALHPHPTVATSGNLAGEPILIENDDALIRLKDIADLFVLHDRPIARACDDSVVRVLSGAGDLRPQILRRARGYTPLPVRTCDLEPVLAVGGHFKNTIAIGFGRQVFLSQHIGELDSLGSRDVFAKTIEDLCKLYRFTPELIVSDLHPDYASTRWAKERSELSGIRLVQVQHHHAHVTSCAAENGIDSDYLGVAWDGTGLGTDGTIWGSEFFMVAQGNFERVAHLRPFLLPGGDAAMRDCSRSAASLLWETLGAERAREVITPGIATMLEQRINAPSSSSMGRLFDGMARLVGIARQNLFEGQAAMCLESAIGLQRSDECYEISCTEGVGDWAPMIKEVLSDKERGVDVSLISMKFHNTLANWILTVARTTGTRRVVLSGGVFQNASLTIRAKRLLEADGFNVFTHFQVPANDGGLALGQAVLGGTIR